MPKVTGFFLHKSFHRPYAKLREEVKKTFRERRDLLLREPNHPLLNNHPLQAEWRNHWSINVTGDIRTIYYMYKSVAVFVEIGDHDYLYGK